MLKRNPNPTFTTPVGISIAGQKAPTEITVEFKYLSKSQARAFYDGLGGKDDATALGEIIVNIEGYEVPFAQGGLADLLEAYPAAATDLYEAFRRELLEAKRKN